MPAFLSFPLDAFGVLLLVRVGEAVDGPYRVGIVQEDGELLGGARREVHHHRSDGSEEPHDPLHFPSLSCWRPEGEFLERRSLPTGFDNRSHFFDYLGMSWLRHSGAGRFVAIAVAVSGLAGGVGCASEAGQDEATVRVEAAFEPLAWLAREVGGTEVAVTDLTPAGVEPHDLELSPKDVAGIQEADLVLLIDGFQPAVDAAAAGRPTVVDARALATPDGGDDELDPHIWLDPTRLAVVAQALSKRLGQIDPAGAEGYRVRSAALVERLDGLDREITAGLAECEVDTLVTSHQAFGWFARRYGFEEVGIAGLSPDREPSPADLAKVADLVAERGVTTIYTEALVDGSVARTVAAEAGVATAVLDPVESITAASPGADYPAVMRANLATLRKGQRCR